MNNIVKKIWSAVLALTITTSLFPANVFAVGAAGTADVSQETNMSVTVNDEVVNDFVATHELIDESTYPQNQDNTNDHNIDSTQYGDVITDVYTFDPYDWYAEEPVMLMETPNLRSTPPTRGSTYNATTGYGGQLTTQQKRVYDFLVSNYIGVHGRSREDISTTIVFSPTYGSFYADSTTDLKNDISRAYWAFIYDYPTAFWAGSLTNSYSYQEDNGLYILTSATLTISETYSGAVSKITSYNEGVMSAISSIYNSVQSDSTLPEYYRAIHDWVCNTLTYNNDSGVKRVFRKNSGEIP